MFTRIRCISGCVRRVSCHSVFHVKCMNNVRPLCTGLFLSIRSKDVPATTAPSASQDILLQNIVSSKSSSDVLNSVNRHHTIMNSNHIVQTFQALFNHQKSHSSKISNGEVINNKDFRALCNVLKSQIRHIELNDLIVVLKCLGYLGVPADSKIMNIIFHLISKQVNDLTLQQIIFLEFVMTDFKKTPLVKALKIALPIVFEANLQKKGDFDNTSQLIDFFFYVSKRKHLENCFDVLVDALLEKKDSLTLKDAKNILLCLCESRNYNHRDNNHLLFCYAMDIITDSIHNIDFYDLDSIMYRLQIRHNETNGEPSYYHEEFCNACARMVIEKDYNIEQTLWILKKLIKFNHTHLPLLVHIAEKVEKEPWLLEQSGATGLIIFLNGFSCADFKPPNWDKLKFLILKTCQSFMDRSELPWLRILLDLCIMDIWSEEMFHKIFDREFLKVFMSRDYNKLDRIQLLLLDQVSATLSPWADKPRAPSDMVNSIAQMVGSHITSFSLQAPLEHGLGGPEYVLTGVNSPLGHFLDHVVVMRKGGFPVAINLKSSEAKERVTTENILVPPDSRMVAVLFLPSSMCAVNSERVRGLLRIQINTIEALGIAVAPILQTIWNTLPDFERIPYLMRAIREKIPSEEMTSVVTPS